jgi:hypothetical protein
LAKEQSGQKPHEWLYVDWLTAAGQIAGRGADCSIAVDCLEAQHGFASTDCLRSEVDLHGRKL